MISSRIAAITLLALSMRLGGFASAQEHGGPRDRNDHPAEQRGSPDRNDRSQGSSARERSDHRGDRSDNDGARSDHNYNQRGESRDQRGEWRGAGPSHDFRRGGHLPSQYRSHQYVVDDWRGHHLSAPPRGYHWVQTGSDYVLAALTTGVILQILLNN